MAKSTRAHQASASAFISADQTALAQERTMVLGEDEGSHGNLDED